MKFGNRGLMAALESDDVQIEETAMVPEIEVEVEQGASDVAADAGEIEALNTVVENAVGDVETLGEIHDSMEEKMEEGEAISPETAEMAEIAVEHIYAKLGVYPVTRPIPAIENFKSKNSANGALKAAVEGIGDTIKSVWAKIVKVLKSIWQKIVDFFAKFFANAEKMKEAAKKVQDQAKNTKGKKNAEKLKLSAVAKAFVDKNGAFAEPGKVLALHGDTTAAYLATSDLLVRASGAMATGLTKPEGESDEDFNKSMAASLTALAKGAQAQVESKTEGGVTTEVTEMGPFVGGTYLRASFTLSEGKFGNFDASFAGGTAAKAEEVPALSADEAGALAGEVVKLMDQTIAFKKQQSKLEAVQKALIKVAETAVSAADAVAKASEDNAAAREKVASIRSAVSKVATAANRMTTMFPAFNVRAGKFALNYASASLKNMGEEKTDDKK